MPFIKSFDVFLSHNSKDKPWCINLKNTLQARGIKVWLDKDEIRPGDLFVGALEAGLEDCDTVVLVVSPESMKSGWVKEEYSRAISLAQHKDHPVRVIPLLLRDAPMPGFLEGRNYVDFRDASAFDESLEHLIFGITGVKQNPTKARL